MGKTAAPSASSVESFGLLQPFWPDLHTLAIEAEQNSDKLPDFSTIRLRSFSESMVCHLFRHHDLPLNSDETHFDRLRILQNEKLLDRRVLGLLHTIRKLGNIAAHNKRPVSAGEARGLVEDARSLAAWFCLHMRPDIDWKARRCSPPIAPTADHDTSLGVHAVGARENNGQNRGAGLATLVRPPQTRISLRDMFEEELTADQLRCISALDGFLADDTQRVFLLKGYAGTGKTFLAGGLTEFLLAQGRMFSLAAPTGRAAKVIAKKTGQSARTIHSLIYDYSDMTERTEDDDDGSATFKMIAKVRNNEDPIDAVAIIDEASLVSNVYSESEFFRSGSGHLLQDLIAHMGSTHSGNARKIIFIGDPAQLPPVGMSTSPALDADYLRETFGLDATGYELTEIVRQKAESAVIRNVMPLREGVVSSRFSSLTFTYDDDVIRLSKDSVTPLYMKIREGRGPQAPIIVTHSNAEAASFNRAIRTVLFPGMATVAAGDSVIVAANGFCGPHYVANGEILRIDAIESAIERRSVQLLQKVGSSDISEPINVALNFRDVMVALSQPEGDDLILKTKILDDFLHGDDASLGSAQQRALYVDFLKRHQHIDRRKQRDEFQLALRSDPYFNALRLRFGYAVTCHKAQGGEWSHVIVSCATRQNPRSSDYFRWLYTAMTRTSGKLYLIDPPEIRLQQAGVGWSTPASAEAGSSSGEPGLPRSDGSLPETNGSQSSAVSPQAMFRSWLQAEIRNRLDGTGVEIEDIALHQYREAYFFKRDAEAARVDIGYKGNWTVSGVTCPKPDGFAEDIMARLAALAGQKPGAVGSSAASESAPERPFLKDFHDRLVAALTQKGAVVVSLKEQAWSQRYVLARGSESVTVDIFYNGKNQLTKFMPVNPAPKPTPSLVELQDDVMTVLSVEVHP
ncbi:ATP-dependent DNA helicase [Aliiruegeria sabulilitoris]|uniref:ATP-dependent DNA helicase n=1 Tax=Aliiruegeria sabulilitoris TaxID=1510458 RepID=UPI0009E8C698|nr:AAA family ATPase [Aliiruegeria sabulilitoris]NDR55359.1 AAA family ATPase [Pseudoruegeria sp. M32A2M]